ncbi:hypothetical protein J3R08_006060 [Micromonospora sp. HB375]|nr:hypothetical protein [Micromonospora sp. HB375]MDH6471855.1 hypothetical protein [Micromonospora sp. H404/HB375]
MLGWSLLQGFAPGIKTRRDVADMHDKAPAR